MADYLDVLRTEKKFSISKVTASEIAAKLSHIIQLDPHCANNRPYVVKSLYFDSLYNQDFQEKSHGLEIRKKIRLRTYGDADVVKLEIKQKQGAKQRKQSLPIRHEEAEALIAGDYRCLMKQENTLALELYAIMTERLYRPKNLGWEQEYFLVDESLWAVRPDLMLTGRTLMGHESAKNQQLEDHYFGAIPARVIAFMKDLEYECLKLGIPVKTRHNEVAPNQFELAPVYEEANLANDHNQLLMSVMDRIARRHRFRVLLHEKPFKGINGSGKHCNWSLGTDTGANLLAPGRTAAENLRFITFLVNVVSAVWKHNGLLKAAIMSAGNAHRLGANEAPPAIVSVFLGSQISAVLDRLEAGDEEGEISFDAKSLFRMNGISHIPTLMIDNTDRNRTSPFAFTGNRFEFRAVGSSDNCAEALIALNAAVAAELTEFRKAVDAKIAAGREKERAVYEVLKTMIRASRPIRFDGNGYSEEWKAEAARRGLDCETSTPRVFDRLLDPATIRIFEETGVLSKVELEARAEVKRETYTKKIQIEGRVLGDLTMNHIVPIASKYEAILLDKVYKMKQIGGGLNTGPDIALIRRIQDHAAEMQRLVIGMIEARKRANRIDDARERAIVYHDTVASCFDEIRRRIDKLEEIVDDQMWPLPKYRELLFLR